MQVKKMTASLKKVFFLFFTCAILNEFLLLLLFFCTVCRALMYTRGSRFISISLSLLFILQLEWIEMSNYTQTPLEALPVVQRKPECVHWDSEPGCNMQHCALGPSQLACPGGQRNSVPVSEPEGETWKVISNNIPFLWCTFLKHLT